MTDQDRDLDAYLSDPRDTPVADVASVERSLQELRADRVLPPFVLPPARRRARWVVAGALAAAAALILLATTYMSWRNRWPSEQPWTVETRAAVTPGALQVGLPLHAASDEEVSVARIGTMRVGAGTDLTLTSTTSNRHRIVLDRGTIDVRIWAPPRSLVVETPAGEVGDLGCQFHLAVDHDGVAHLTVLTGWVQMNNGFGETLVPAGASATLAADRRPRVPVYDDATSAFRDAVRHFETGSTAADDATVIVSTARRRDVLTLLVLAIRTEGTPREQLLRRAARLSPPPDGVSFTKAMGGDNDEVWRWYGALPLPPPKASWWRNWRDGLPAWLGSRHPLR
jgi:hypothetical protein